MRFGDVSCATAGAATRKEGECHCCRNGAADAAVQNHDCGNSLVFADAAQGFDAVRAGEDRSGRHAEKEAMLHHPRNSVERARERSWIGNAAKRCIDDEMTAVGDEGRALAHPQRQRAGKAERGRRAADRELGRPEAEAVDLDRQRKGAERVDALRAVGDHDHALRCRGDDLLAQQRAAAALDRARARRRSRRRRRW